MGLAFCVGLGFGTFESNVPQRMPQYGLSADLGGLFLLLLAIGSMAGGTYVSLRPIRRRRTARKASVLFAVFALLMLPSILAPTALVYGGCLLFASLMLVPINGLGTSELEARIGEKQRAEAFSCYQAATMIGGGLGSVINGILVEPLRGVEHSLPDRRAVLDARGRPGHRGALQQLPARILVGSGGFADRTGADGSRVTGQLLPLTAASQNSWTGG